MRHDVLLELGEELFSFGEGESQLLELLAVFLKYRHFVARVRSLIVRTNDQLHLYPHVAPLHAVFADYEAYSTQREGLSQVFDALDAYQGAVNNLQQTAAATSRAQRQQLQRLRYQAAFAQRQFDHVDPTNRLVAAELERRWETALRELEYAEVTLGQPPQAVALEALPADLQAALRQLGQTLPPLWSTEVLSQTQKKALLRCLLNKVVLQRLGRGQVHIRIVWRGEEVTEYMIPIRVGSLAALSTGPELAARVVALSQAGKTDPEIAQEFSAAGFRSPKHCTLLVSTVSGLRRKQGCFQIPHRSHPYVVKGFLTTTQAARRLKLPAHWLYTRIRKGQILLQKDPSTRLFLFPDHPSTWDQLTRLWNGQLQQVGFGKGHQDA